MDLLRISEKSLNARFIISESEETNSFGIFHKTTCNYELRGFRNVYVNNFDFWNATFNNLSGDLATIEASPGEPRLELENRGITIEPQSNGKPKITFHASFTSRFPPEVAVAIRETGLIGEGFSRVEAALEGP